MGRGSSSFCRSGSRTRRDQLERFQAKACPGLDPGWKPVRVKKTRQIKNREPRFDSIEAEKALECRGEGYYRSTLDVRVSAAKQQAVRSAVLRLVLSVAIATCFHRPRRLVCDGEVVDSWAGLGGASCDNGVALRTKPAPRTLRIIGASFGPSTLRRSRPK